MFRMSQNPDVLKQQDVFLGLCHSFIHKTWHPNTGAQKIEAQTQRYRHAVSVLHLPPCGSSLHNVAQCSVIRQPPLSQQSSLQLCSELCNWKIPMEVNQCCKQRRTQLACSGSRPTESLPQLQASRLCMHHVKTCCWPYALFKFHHGTLSCAVQKL